MHLYDNNSGFKIKLVGKFNEITGGNLERHKESAQLNYKRLYLSPRTATLITRGPTLVPITGLTLER